MKRKFLLAIIFCSAIVFSQEKQPKVGLVLSGGGAKGFAHIGVLKELEKAGVQIDMIGGTSMGAIVGGLYAIGYSANQIEKIVTETDFLALLRDENPRETKPFFEKEYGETEFITLPVMNGKIGFPRAISKGQNILGFMSSLLRPVDSILKFKNLPIPFFCVATDIETGQQVLLEEGSLPMALRASGSFPTLLSPVEIDGKLLIDGGVSNNFPADIMKEKGADIIIGIDVQGKLNERTKLNSAVAILNQIVSYKMYENSADQLKNIDVYIHPNIYEYSVIDFDKGKEILERGAIAAAEKREFFDKIAAMQIVKRDEFKIEIKEEFFYIDSIAVSGNDRYTRSYILGKLNLKVNDSSSMIKLAKQISYLSATNNFDRINYRVFKENGKTTVNFMVTESREKASLSLGVHYDYLYKSGLLINYKHKRLLSRNDLLSANLIIGDNLRFDATYFIDNGFYLSTGIKTRYNHFRALAPFTSNGGVTNINKVNLKYSDATTQAFIQTAFRRKFAVGLGAEFKGLDVTTETLNSATTNSTVYDNSFYANAFGYLKFDSYDKKVFPTKGFFGDIGFKWYAWSSDFNDNFKPFTQAKGKIGFATTFWNTLTFQYTGEGGFSFGNPESNVFDFYLGGNNGNYINTFVSFFGYEFSELTDTSFVKSEFNFRYQFYPKNYVSLIANYARLQDDLLQDIDIFSDVKSGYALGYGYESFVGPIELKYAWSPDNNNNYIIFNLGFWF